VETAREWELLGNTAGQYSMDTARKLVAGLERDGWEQGSRGDLVEQGIELQKDGCTFQIMCSYEDIFVRRISGNKAKYHEVCEQLRQGLTHRA
jgi:hypothetical protein